MKLQKFFIILCIVVIISNTCTIDIANSQSINESAIFGSISSDVNLSESTYLNSEKNDSTLLVNGLKNKMVKLEVEKLGTVLVRDDLYTIDNNKIIFLANNDWK